MRNLDLHRLEVIEDGNGGSRLKRVAENPEQNNIGVKYWIGVEKIDDRNAQALGWATPGGYLCRDEGPRCGEVYAPNGFKVGEVAFVKIDDPMITASTMDMHDVDSFLESLGKSEAMHTANITENYSLIGEIESCF